MFRYTLPSIVLTAALLVPLAATSQDLHVGTGYDDCHFDLHPELSQAEFDTLAGEVGAILRFTQLSSAETLGRLNFDFGIAYTSTSIDDSDGAWNDSFSHPAENHYLGDRIAFPRLQLRMGVTDTVDVGVWGSLNPNSNYGFVGVESKVAILRVADGAPVDVSARPHVSTLLGPEEVTMLNVSTDLSVSRSWYGVAPYLGVGGAMSAAFNRANDVDLETAVAWDATGFGGVEYRWTYVSAALQAELGTAGVPTFGGRLSATF